MMVKSGLELFILKFNEPLQRYLLTCPVQFSLTGQIFLHLAAATLKRVGEFQKKKFKTTFHHHFMPKMSISRLKILVHLLKEF